MLKTSYALLTFLILIAEVRALNVLEPEVAWSKRDIRVCFASFENLSQSLLSRKLDRIDSRPEYFPDYTSEEKQIIKNVVSREFQKKNLGLSFVGWKDCKDEPYPDAQIFKQNSPYSGYTGMATIGEKGQLFQQENFFGKSRLFYSKLETGLLPFVTLNFHSMNVGKMPLKQNIEYVTLHEFGHLAGLRHEHVDSPGIQTINWRLFSKDVNCTNTGMVNQETFHSSTRKVSVYDPNSIMNYCYMLALFQMGTEFHIPWYSSREILMTDSEIVKTSVTPTGAHYKVRIGLSQGDQHALRCLYFFDKKTKKDFCHPHFDPKVFSF